MTTINGHQRASFPQVRLRYGCSRSWAASPAKPACSPDGTKLRFAAGNALSSHLYVVGIDGSGIKQLTTDG